MFCECYKCFGPQLCVLQNVRTVEEMSEIRTWVINSTDLIISKIDVFLIAERRQVEKYLS